MAKRGRPTVRVIVSPSERTTPRAVGAATDDGARACATGAHRPRVCGRAVEYRSCGRLADHTADGRHVAPRFVAEAPRRPAG